MRTLEAEFNAIYEAILGDSDRVPWVRNAWNDDTAIARGYETLWQCRQRLADRLEIADFSKDEDLESMMDAISQIQKDLCRRMFYCTLHYATRKYTE